MIISLLSQRGFLISAGQTTDAQVQSRGTDTPALKTMAPLAVGGDGGYPPVKHSLPRPGGVSPGQCRTHLTAIEPSRHGPAPSGAFLRSRANHRRTGSVQRDGYASTENHGSPRGGRRWWIPAREALVAEARRRQPGPVPHPPDSDRALPAWAGPIRGLPAFHAQPMSGLREVLGLGPGAARPGTRKSC